MNVRPEYDFRVIGANLKRFRMRKGLSVEQVRRYMQLGSTQAIYKWERGDGLPQADSLMALLEYYEVYSFYSLLEEEDSQESSFLLFREQTRTPSPTISVSKGAYLIDNDYDSPAICTAARRTGSPDFGFPRAYQVISLTCPSHNLHIWFYATLPIQTATVLSIQNGLNIRPFRRHYAKKLSRSLILSNSPN